MVNTLRGIFLCYLIPTLHAQTSLEKILEFNWQDYNTPLTSLETPHHFLSLNERSLIGISKSNPTLKLWSTKASAPYALMTSVALSPNGSLVVAINQACEVIVLDEKSGQEIKMFSSSHWGACIGAHIEGLFLSDHELLLRYGNYVKVLDLNASDTNFNLNDTTYEFDRDDREATMLFDRDAESLMLYHKKYNGPCSLQTFKARTGELLTEQHLASCAIVLGPAMSPDRLLTRYHVQRNPDQTSDFMYRYLDLNNLDYKQPIIVKDLEFETAVAIDADRFAISTLKSCTVKVYSFKSQAQIGEIKLEDRCRSITSMTFDSASKHLYVSGLFATGSGHQPKAMARMYRMRVNASNVSKE